jgi:hypothetical protein
LKSDNVNGENNGGSGDYDKVSGLFLNLKKSEMERKQNQNGDKKIKRMKRKSRFKVKLKKREISPR